MTVLPTDDFFRHVNGQWLDTFEIPQDRAGDGQMRQLHDAAEVAVRDIITGLGTGAGDGADAHADATAPAGSAAQMVSDLYASFMDTQTIEDRGLEPLQPLFDLVKNATDHQELARVSGELYRHGVSGVIAAYVSPDAMKSDTYAMYVMQDGITLPDESYYSDDQYSEIRTKFVEHIDRLAQLTDLEEHTGFSSSDLAAHVLSLETDMASHHWDRVAVRDAQKTYNPVTRAELVELTEGFDVDAWLDALGVDSSVDHFIVGQPSAVTGDTDVWAQSDLEGLKAWMIYRILNSRIGALPEAVVDEHFDFFSRTLSGTPQIRERWKRGVSLVEGYLGEVVGKLYVEKYFPPESKDAIRKLVDALIEAYRQSITSLDWMGEETKQKALTKLSQFTPKVGYPDVWREYNFEVKASDLAGNVDRATVAETKRHIDRINQPIDPNEWLMNPQTVNAYYHPVLNEIVFPAAILQPPFFDADGLPASNYGAIGAVIGHEIGHGFDDQGSRYDGTGNLVNWWTDEDRERFTQRVQGLIDQYDVLVPEGLEPTDTVNGSLTVGENIGDLGGLGIAWKALDIASGGNVSQDDARAFFTAWAVAWKSKFRAEERRRRLAVDPHSPEEFRCNQVLKNMDAFHETFGTKPGDGMWLDPAQRVTIW